MKAALAKASRRLVDESGPEGLTIRAAAKAASVTANAPYFYFPAGVNEMLAVVAIEGFVELIAALEKQPIASGPLDRARERMHRYVRFGVDNQNLYRAMFSARLVELLHDVGGGSEPGRDTFRTLHQSKSQAFLALIEPLQKLAAGKRLRGNVKANDAGLTLAALAHGLVGGFIDEGLARTERLQRKMTSEAVDILFRGLVSPRRNVLLE